MRALNFEAKDAERWDDLVTRAPMGTFLHTRRFFAYHGQRFEDTSLLVVDGERLVAVFPAAVQPGRRDLVTSHPGSSYGGLVHGGDLAGNRVLDALRAVLAHYSGCGYSTLRYKVVPHVYHRTPAEDDVHALFRLGARLSRCDLSAAIDLRSRRKPSSRRERGARKASKAGVVVVGGVEGVREFWPLLEQNLAVRHGVAPVHSVDEILHLHSLFPDVIEFAFAEVRNHLIGGVVLFQLPSATHVQYVAADDDGRNVSALDAVLERSIESAHGAGKRYFSFGVSTEHEGRVLNDSLHRYKVEFGGGGVIHQFFDIDLRQFRE